MPLFNNSIDVDVESPLPEYGGAYAWAFAAKGRGATATPLLALICHDVLPVRADLVQAQRSITNPALLHVRDGGVMEWPLTGKRHYAFIYDRPVGQRLAPFAHEGAFKPLSDDVIADVLIKPIGSALMDLSRMAITHGAVRADNIFVSQGEVHAAMLGDHLAQPPGWRQPGVYETIERGMAPDYARGPTHISDDFYAFGVTILTALLGDMPLKGLSDEAIIHLKMERGSYQALAGERRFNNGMNELLRGLLADEAKERWGVKDFEMWLSGRRLAPKPASAVRKASRMLRFGGQEFHSMRPLAYALTKDTKLSASLIQSGEMTRWVGHAFSDENTEKYLEESLLVTRRQRIGPEEERLVTNTITVLDPRGPLRYRGISVLPAGVPVLLAQMVLEGAAMQIIAELLTNDFVTQWLNHQPHKRPDIVAAVQALEQVKPVLEKQGLGFGIERVIYELNTHMPCLSSAVRQSYVLTMRQMLEALDARTGHPWVLDRHLAAFILVRDKKVLPSIMRSYEQAKDNSTRTLALLTLLSDLQYRHGPDALKGLAGTLLVGAEETVKRFHYRPRQEKIRKDLKAAAAAGDLGQMLALVDDPDMLQRDAEEFEAARFIFQTTSDEMLLLAAQAKNKKALAVQAGEPLAATIAIGLAFVLLALVVLRAVLWS